MPALSSFHFTASSVIGNLLFSAIGFVAFTYGKRTGSLRTMITGGVLMGYTYVVSDPVWLMYAVGAALTASLFLAKD